MKAYDVLVIGGGNLGLWTALRLARRDTLRVAVLERGRAGEGATIRSAGTIRQQGGSGTAVGLAKLSRELYLKLGEELGLDPGFTQTGHYLLAASEGEKEAAPKLIETRRAAGVENEWVEPEEGRRRFPDLDWDRFVGATYTPTDGYVHPPTVVRNVTCAVLASETVDLFEACEVRGVEERGDRYCVETTRGVFEAERVVNAGGPRGAREVGEMVGVDVPVAFFRHQAVTFPSVPEGTTHPFPLVVDASGGYYARPEERGALVGMSEPFEEAGPEGLYGLAFDRDLYEEKRLEWEAAFPALKGLPVSRAWAAPQDVTPDMMPIVDRPLEGFYVVAAAGQGMTWGPALGEKMAGLVADGEASDLPGEEVGLARFAA